MNKSKTEIEAELKAQKDWRETSEYKNTFEKGSLASLAYNLEFSKLADVFGCGAYNYA